MLLRKTLGVTQVMDHVCSESQLDILCPCGKAA
jgi:hypothetical protein